MTDSTGFFDARPTKEFFEAYHRVCGKDADERPAAVLGALRRGLGDQIRSELSKIMAERRALDAGSKDTQGVKGK